MKSFGFNRLFPLAILAILQSGCSILVGSVNPVDEKQDGQFWTDVSIMDSDFKNLHEESENLDSPDAAWQSKTTAAIISITSACRDADTESDVNEVTESLLAQWNDSTIESKVPAKVSNHDALQTSGKGTYLGKVRTFEVIVVKSPTCLYDVLYLSPPEAKEKHLPTFNRFKASLKLE